MALYTPHTPESLAPLAQALSDDLSSRIGRYWSRRAEGYGHIRHKELHSDKKALWLQEIVTHCPAVGVRAGAGAGVNAPSPLRILDVGTGTGFFAIVLAELGHAVTAVDMCADMLREGVALAAQAGCRVDFQQMDASRLDFASESFDVVISRNVTWTVPDAAAAYVEWRRVLRPGGTLLNFDADYGAATFAQEDYAWMHAHQGMDEDMTRECDSIMRRLPLSGVSRPQWDMEVLQGLGFGRCACDAGISERIYVQRDETYNPVPMFCLSAVKA